MKTRYLQICREFLSFGKGKRSIFVALVVLTLAAVIVVTSIVVAKSGNVAKSEDMVSSSRQKAAKQDPPGTIDGAINKYLISDQAAYTILLRFVSHQPQANKAAIDSYLKFHGFGETDIAAIKASAEDFRQRVAVVDGEAKKIKDKEWPNPTSTAMDNLTRLQQEKDAIVNGAMNSLLTRLSSQGQEKLNYLIKDNIKAKMKLYPPLPPPGGTGWEKKEKHH